MNQCYLRIAIDWSIFLCGFSPVVVIRPMHKVTELRSRGIVTLGALGALVALGALAALGFALAGLWTLG